MRFLTCWKPCVDYVKLYNHYLVVHEDHHHPKDSGSLECRACFHFLKIFFQNLLKRFDLYAEESLNLMSVNIPSYQRREI